MKPVDVILSILFGALLANAFDFTRKLRLLIKHDSPGPKLKDVKPGDKIYVTAWDGFVYSGTTCLENSPGKKKIFVRFNFVNGQSSHEVLKYSDKRLKDFSLINSVKTEHMSSAIEADIEREIVSCEKTEDYERAAILKETLEKLGKEHK